MGKEILVLVGDFVEATRTCMGYGGSPVSDQLPGMSTEIDPSRVAATRGPAPSYEGKALFRMLATSGPATFPTYSVTTGTN